MRARVRHLAIVLSLPLAACASAGAARPRTSSAVELRGLQTRSYQDIATKVGGSARSVGQANSQNPIPVIIPCHRVVAASHIGGYSGGEGLPTKRWLLALENLDQILA